MHLVVSLYQSQSPSCQLLMTAPLVKAEAMPLAEEFGTRSCMTKWTPVTSDLAQELITPVLLSFLPIVISSGDSPMEMIKINSIRALYFDWIRGEPSLPLDLWVVGWLRAAVAPSSCQIWCRWCPCSRASPLVELLHRRHRLGLSIRNSDYSQPPLEVLSSTIGGSLGSDTTGHIYRMKFYIWKENWIFFKQGKFNSLNLS